MATDKKKKRAKPGTPARTPRRFRLALLAGAVALAATAFFLLWPRPLRLSFPGLDAKSVQQLEAVLDAWSDGSGIGLAYVPSNDGEPSPVGSGKVDACFVYLSIQNARFSGSFRVVGASLLGNLPPTLEQAATADGKAWALPLLADTREIAWQKRFFGQEGPTASLPAELGAEASSMVGKVALPFLLRGGDDSELLDIAGALAMERGGIRAYDALADLTAGWGGGDDISAVLEGDLGGFSLARALDPLPALVAQGTLHLNWTDFKEGDAYYFVTQGDAGIAMQTLAFHRGVKRESLEAWRSRALVLGPDRAGGTMAVATARVIALARPASGRRQKAFEKLASWLVSPEGQSALQDGTGLAPTAASAQAADIQARDAREAISGARIVGGLSLDGFPSPQTRKEFATALRLYLMSQNR